MHLFSGTHWFFLSLICGQTIAMEAAIVLINTQDIDPIPIVNSH